MEGFDDLTEAERTEQQREAFGYGADARINGFIDNPYQHGDVCWRRWREGWMHCHKFWGIDAKWTVKPLPMPESYRRGA